MSQNNIDNSKGYVAAAVSRTLYFGRTSSIHGLRHVFKERIHMFSRLFWICVLLFSGYCVYVFLLPLLQLGSPVSFMPDTLYLTWQTTFPAVSVCEDLESQKDVNKQLMNTYPDLFKTLDFKQQKDLINWLYGHGKCQSSYDCPPCGTGFPPCDLPLREMIEMGLAPCEVLLKNCRLNGKEIPCCKWFRQTDYMAGICYTFNGPSKPDDEQLFRMNQSTGPGQLYFEVNRNIKLMIHSPEEPVTTYSMTSLVKIVRGTIHTVLISLVGMYSDNAFRRESVEVRECRYPHELMNATKMHTYQVYSYGACKTAWETQETYDICGCVHPVRDKSYEPFYCNITGIFCLYTLKAKITSQLNAEHKEPDGVCLPSCDEQEIKQVSFKMNMTGDTTTQVTVQMAHLPTIRYLRTLFRTNLDVVVTIGGLAGLFFGASILSVAEIQYLLIRRP